MAEVNGPGRPLVAEPQIAMFCGHQLLHMNTETAQWQPDPQGRQGCFTLPSQILSYCQEVRPPQRSWVHTTNFSVITITFSNGRVLGCIRGLAPDGCSTSQRVV